MTSINNKDLSLLKEVSNHFTEETLKNIVAKDKNVNPKNVEILNWNFSAASAKGDSYLSVVNRVQIKSEINKEVLETRIIVKSLPNNMGRRKTFRSVEFFHNEIVFYTEVATRFEEYLKFKGQSQLLLIPKCLASHLDGENDFIVLEDVSYRGFGPICRQSCLSYEQCKYIVETLAKFHAISFGFKNERKEEFEKMTALLTETFFSEELYENWYKRFHTTVLLRIAKDSLAKEYPGSKGEQVFNSYEPGALVKKSIEFCAMAKAPTSVIGQGDAWAPNFLGREVSPGKFDVLMIDFQLARCASPVIDVTFFIYACTDQPMRDEHYDNLLENYYTELVKSMKLLDVDPEKVYPHDVFLKEVKEQAVCGLTFALEAVPFTMMPEEEAFDLDQIKEDVVDIADVFTLSNIQISEHRKRHAEIILHAVERGFI